MIDHTIRAFDTDLQQLAGKVSEMGRLDSEQIADAVTALLKRDTALAERVIATADRVDGLQREIEEKAVATIARRQPMAVDLREIVGTLRISQRSRAGWRSRRKYSQARVTATQRVSP